MEVNHSPSFHTDSKMDKEIKDQLLVDTFRMLHVRASDKQAALIEDRRLTQQVIFPLSPILIMVVGKINWIKEWDQNCTERDQSLYRIIIKIVQAEK